MFEATDDTGKRVGFLSVQKGEDGMATIDHIQADDDNTDILRDLIERAMRYLAKKGIMDVSIRVADQGNALEHVLHDHFDFHREGEEGDDRIYKAHVKPLH